MIPTAASGVEAAELEGIHMENTAQADAAAFIVQLIPLLILTIFLIPPYIRIFRRIGRSPWLSLLALVPLGFLILPWMLAFMRWDKKPAEVADVFG